jgi:FixJ family two-component response regulator
MEALLIIASDVALRRSLTFLLEAEGYVVQAHASIDQAARSSPASRRCVVIDDEAIADDGIDWATLGELADAVVLLISRDREMPAGQIVLPVEKPYLGDNLVRAVRSALLPRPAAAGR